VHELERHMKINQRWPSVYARVRARVHSRIWSGIGSSVGRTCLSNATPRIHGARVGASTLTTAGKSTEAAEFSERKDT